MPIAGRLNHRPGEVPQKLLAGTQGSVLVGEPRGPHLASGKAAHGEACSSIIKSLSPTITIVAALMLFTSERVKFGSVVHKLFARSSKIGQWAAPSEVSLP